MLIGHFWGHLVVARLSSLPLFPRRSRGQLCMTRLRVSPGSTTAPPDADAANRFARAASHGVDPTPQSGIMLRGDSQSKELHVSSVAGPDRLLRLDEQLFAADGNGHTAYGLDLDPALG